MKDPEYDEPRFGRLGVPTPSASGPRDPGTIPWLPSDPPRPSLEDCDSSERVGRPRRRRPLTTQRRRLVARPNCARTPARPRPNPLTHLKSTRSRRFERISGGRATFASQARKRVAPRGAYELR
jgi:hypothetical protein